MSRKAKKRIVKLSLWMAIVAGIGGGFFLYRQRATAKKAEKPRLVKARKGSLSVTVSATGSVEPEYIVDIKSKASGEILKVVVEEGQRVKKGDLLVSIDPIIEKRRLNQAKAELRMAKARSYSAWRKRSFAKSQLSRDLKLAKKGLVSTEAVDTRAKEVGVLGADASVAQAQIEKAKNALQEAEDRFAETRIVAPADGTVLKRLVQPGQIVASGTNSVSGGTTLLKIADLSKLFVQVKVDEADVAKLTPGLPVRITADALARRTFTGKVLRIAPQGTVESNVTVFEILVSADEAGSKALKPMMSANVEVIIEERPPAVLLASKALRRDRKARSFYVLLANGKRQDVKIGKRLGSQVEIAEGLAAGAEVQLKPVAAKKNSNARRQNARKQRGMQRMMGGGGRGGRR